MQFKKENLQYQKSFHKQQEKQSKQMSIKRWLSIKTFGILILAGLLFLCCLLIWRLGQIQSENPIQTDKYSMFMNKYNIQRSNRWSKAFDGLGSKKHQQVKFEQKDHQLLINGKYVAKIGEQGEHYEQTTISNVIDLSKKQLNSKYFLVRSQLNQQLFYSSILNNNQQLVENRQNKAQGSLIQLEKCYELNNMDIKYKLNYMVDNKNNIWLISHPHNNILFIQIYNCQKRQLIKKIFHQPQHNNRKYMVNQFISITQSQSIQQNQIKAYQIKILTYESHQYILTINQSNYDIASIQLNPSYQISSQLVSIPLNTQSHSSVLSYIFLDPLNKILQQQFNYLLFSALKDFAQQLKILLKNFGFDTKSLYKFITQKLKQYQNNKQLQYLDFNLQLIDTNDHCLTNLQYHIPSNSSQTNSSITRLNQFIYDTKTPIFHNKSHYDQYDIVQILKNQKTPQTIEFKRLQLDQGYNKQYHTHHFYSVYNTYPDSKVHFMGLGQKIFYLYPQQNIKEEDYFQIRSKTGALIMKGNKIAGVYEDRPLSKNQQVRQKVFIQSNQVLPGIYQAHAGYQSLFSVLNGNKVELVNGLSGKTMITYQINIKQGYQYANSFILNNQWWIVVYNQNTKLSELVKHELYVQKAYPKQIDSTKRTYGKILNSQFQQGQDDLGTIFNSYINQVSNQGIVIIDIFRCLDQFYYIQFVDTKGQNYAIARIHFKRLSNRLPKISNQYASDLQSRLLVKTKDIVKSKQKSDPFLLVFPNSDFFKGIQVLINQNIFNLKNYSVKQGDSQKIISLMKKMNQFEPLPYSVISTQNLKGTWNNNPQSKQQIKLFNMRVLVEHAKKRHILETQRSSRNRLKYLSIVVGIILLSLIIKMMISDSLKKVEEQKSKQKKEQKMSGTTGSKIKNKKQKSN